MNVLEQLNKFVTTALQNNDKVIFEGKEISDIKCQTIKRMSSICQRIQFKVIFTVSEEEHTYHLDIDTRTIETTDDRFYMETILLPYLGHQEHKTIRINDQNDGVRNCIYTISFRIEQNKRLIPIFTIDVNDL